MSRMRSRRSPRTKVSKKIDEINRIVDNLETEVSKFSLE
jgi:hypothetical protein